MTNQNDAKAEQPTEEEPFRSLLDEFRESKRDFMRIWGPGLLVTLAAFGITWFFLEPAPPDTLVIASGPRDGAYYRFAEEYAAVFAEEGVTLKVIPTQGSLENYRMLIEDPEVNLAIVQGGTSSTLHVEAGLEALASLYLEPVWVFYRSDETKTELRQMATMRIAIGNPDSGTRALASRLLLDNGVSPALENAEFVNVGGTEAAEQLQQGKVDAAIFVMSGNSPIIRLLASDRSIKLMNFSRHEAYRRRYPFLTSVRLEGGVIDLEDNLPDQAVYLLAPAANLVATEELHDAFIPLLMKATHRVHERGGMFVDPGQFPSLQYVEFDVNESARQYFESGPSFLQKYVPFWVASAIDRCKILLLPMLTLLIPLFKLAPPLYRWRIRSRIYQWYGVLRKVDQRVKSEANPAVLLRDRRSLHTMEQELGEVSVPLSYMQEFYSLRMHLDLVRRRLEDRLGEIQSSQQPNSSESRPDPEFKQSDGPAAP